MFEATEGGLDSIQETTQELPESSSQETATPTAQDVFDLDSAEKFKFGGREWTPKELTSSVMMNADYTRKTQELSKERKYYDNLDADLKTLQGNPALIDQFKQIYPEKFHRYLEFIQVANRGGQASSRQQAGVDPQFMSRLEQVENRFREQEIGAIEAQLDAKFTVLSKKYPFADEEAVIARAERLLESKPKGEKKLTDSELEQLWKQVDSRGQELAKKHWGQKAQQQKEMNARGKDVASGGWTPGQAPRRPRTIREASDLARRELGLA